MPSNLYIQQYVSPTAPIGVVLGDEWINPTTSKLYKQTLINGVVGWLDITPGATATATAVAPSVTSSVASAAKTIVNTAVAYNVTSTDLGKIINCTSSTFTVSLTAAATLGSGFTCTIWNTGTGAITIDPDASETIDGVATLILRKGEGTDVVCNGTNWETSYKKTMRGYAENFPSNITRPSVTQDYGLAIGDSAIASGTNGALALGINTTASGQASTALGRKATASAFLSTAIGANSSDLGSQAAGTGSMALGGSYAGGTNSFAAAISDNTNTYGAKGEYSIAIGRLASASGNNSVAIGTGSSGVGAVTSVAANGAIALGASYASGIDSISIGITKNTISYGATGDNSIAIGVNATASGLKCMAIGPYAQATGYWSIAIGASNSDPTTASGAYAVAIGSNFATASGAGSVALGNFSKAQQDGKFAFSSKNFSNANANEAQFGMIVLGNSTTTSTPVVLISWGSSVTTTNQLVVASDQAMTFFGTLIAKQATSANMASYMIKGAIVNNAGTVSISSISIDTIVDTIGLTTQPTFTVDATNKALAVTSGAKATTNIRWVCTLQTAEVTYA